MVNANVIPFPGHGIAGPYHCDIGSALRIRELQLIIEPDMDQVVSCTCGERRGKDAQREPQLPRPEFEPLKHAR